MAVRNPRTEPAFRRAAFGFRQASRRLADQLAFRGFVEIALALGIGAAMAHDLIAARAAGRDQPRRIVVHRAVDQRGQRQAERIEGVEHVPGADAVAVIAPREVENVGLRSARRQFRTEPFAVGEMLQIEREIDGEPAACSARCSRRGRATGRSRNGRVSSVASTKRSAAKSRWATVTQGMKTKPAHQQPLLGGVVRVDGDEC